MFKNSNSELFPWNWFLGSINIYKYGLRLHWLAELVPWNRFLGSITGRMKTKTIFFGCANSSSSTQHSGNCCTTLFTTRGINESKNGFGKKGWSCSTTRPPFTAAPIWFSNGQHEFSDWKSATEKTRFQSIASNLPAPPKMCSLQTRRDGDTHHF